MNVHRSYQHLGGVEETTCICIMTSCEFLITCITQPFFQCSCNSEADNRLSRLLDGGLGSKRGLEDGVTVEVVKV